MYNQLHHQEDDFVFQQVDRFVRQLAKGKLIDAVFSSARVRTDDYKEFYYRIIYVLGTETYKIEAKGPAVDLISWEQITSPTNETVINSTSTADIYMMGFAGDD